MKALRLGLVTVAALLAGCAGFGGGTPDELPADTRRGAEVEQLCFIRSISGFGDVTSRSVIVQVGARKYYQIETAGECDMLEQAQSLAFSAVSSCLAAGDKIFAFRSRLGRNQLDPAPFGCLVRAIYEWTPGQPAESAADAEDGAR